MEWLSFVDSCRTYFDAGKVGSLYPLVEAIDALYRIAPEKAPFLRSKNNDEPCDSFDRVFFSCHRTFMSAAMATASGLPEDGEAITRRALEAAKTCLAIKLDPDNGEIWRAEQDRVQRWQQRGQGQTPKPLKLHYQNMQTEPLYKELQAEIASLSDFSLHFTPEFFGRYAWEERPRPDGGYETSFGLIEGAVELGFLMLCKHHELVLRVFDRCQDGRIFQHAEIAHALELVYQLHEHYRKLVTPSLSTMLERVRP